MQVLHYTQFLTDFAKYLDGPVNIGAGMSGRHLGADSRLALRHHRE
ncbi:hypothetical protein MPL3356_510008 [Mesorhizobium plurifarium]|uniref:Uncharacterized protein n=1 Tax=Mesorhizobium plurifarium TaxID=69974 RepID=A0A090EBM0_MESPL|nr:hypothetical protein MPL3356_510008 [Mesorhizobium plurifarium]